MDLPGALEVLSTTVISDACDHLGVECKWLSQYLQPTHRKKFWGYADTVQWSASRKGLDIRACRGSTWDEISGFINNISSSTQPKVYIAGCKNISDEYVLLGGLSLTYIEQSGYAGVIANGRIRDYEEVANLTIPIWFTSYGVMDSQGCMVVSDVGGGCTVNGFHVEQGEIIFGDGNGVLAIPGDVAPRLLRRALEIENIESGLILRVKAGESLPDMIQGGGHI